MFRCLGKRGHTPKRHMSSLLNFQGLKNCPYGKVLATFPKDAYGAVSGTLGEGVGGQESIFAPFLSESR